MADEFDATRTTYLPPAIIMLAIVVLLGVALDLAGRWLAQSKWVKQHRRVRLILYSLRWQPTLWSIILGVEFTLPRAWIASAAARLGINPLLWLAIMSVAILVVRVLTALVARFLDDRNMPSTSLLTGVVTAIGLGVVGLIGVGLLGAPINSLLIAIAGSSVGIGLALQQPLTNLFAGLCLSASNRFKPGEWIRLNTGQEGRVVDVNWLQTTLQDLSGNLIAVPNLSLMTATIVNFDRPTPPMTIAVPVAVSRASDLALVERVTLEVANSMAPEVEGVMVDEPPSIIYPLGFDDYVARFSVTLRISSFLHQNPVRAAFVQRLEGRYLAEGITIVYPIGQAPANGQAPDGVDMQRDLSVQAQS